MKTLIIFLMTMLSLQFAEANPSTIEEITIIGRIQGKGSALRVIRSLEGDALSGMLQTQELEKELAGLQQGDEVLIKGYVTYQNLALEGGTQNTPIFIVQSLKPISLSRLGRIEDTKLPEIQYMPMPLQAYSPEGIPVTTQVASAITLTSSMLLLQSLNSGPYDKEFGHQLNSGLILFAGAMATGFFIYEQIVGTKN